MIALENGEIGRIDGRIGIGAAFVGAAPFVHVARLFPNGPILGRVYRLRSGIDADGLCVNRCRSW